MLAAPQASEFVYDFLYQDVRRVGYFLSQFVQSGHLQNIKQVNTVEDSEQLDAGGSAAANLAVARAQGQVSRRVGSGLKEAMERTYDPVWTNAIDLLTYLNDRAMLQRDVMQAHAGQFVMARGTLGIIDLTLLQTVWAVPALRKTAESAVTLGVQGQASYGSKSKSQAKAALADIAK